MPFAACQCWLYITACSLLAGQALSGLQGFLWYKKLEDETKSA